GPLEVTFILKFPYADMPYALSDYHLLIMPEGGQPDAGIGTGPYVLDSFEPGVRAFSKRNENYWKEGRGHADTVETIAINDASARGAALQTGAAHFINRPDLKTIEILRGAPGLKIIDVPGSGHNTFPMLTDQAPFDNNDLRLA